MILEILLAICLGVTFGIFTGLTPGLHTNTLAGLLPLAALYAPVSGMTLIAGLMAMSVTHTILDAIPSLLLGVPESSLVVAALPGHQLLLQGRGKEALWLTLVGSLGACLCGVFLFLPFIFVLPLLHSLITPYIGYCILGVLVLLLARESKRVAALCTLVLAGIFGWSVFHIEQVTAPLYLMLTSLFGTSLLWCSLTDTQQAHPLGTLPKTYPKLRYCLSCVVATIAGACAAFLPGVGTAQVTILAQTFVHKTQEVYLVLSGALNTVAMLLSLATVYVLDKARNGSIVALRDLVTVDISLLLVLLGVMCCAAACAAFVFLPIADRLQQCIAFVGVQRVTITLFVALFVLGVWYDGMWGLFVMVLGTVGGVLVQQLHLPKHYLMGCLVVPVLLYFL